MAYKTMKTLTIEDTTYEIVDEQSRNDIERFGGTVEITSGIPDKENTVLTLNPDANEVHIYSAKEIDSQMRDVSNQMTELSDRINNDIRNDISGLQENVGIISEKARQNYQLIGAISEQKADKSSLTLGVGADGLIYLFVNGVAQGNGFEFTGNVVAGDVVGYVDSNNNIILTGALVDGSYVLKYEDAEGATVDIGTLTVGGAKYTNLADPTSADWLTNKRLNSSGEIKDATPALTTNYIPVKLGDEVRIRYMNIYHQGSATDNATTHFYDANKNRIASITPATSSGSEYMPPDADGLGFTFDMTKISERFTLVSGHTASEIRYARFVGKCYDGYTANDIIITVNQEITD